MPQRRSIALVLLLATAHVALAPVAISALLQPSPLEIWPALALGLCAAQVGLLTVWLNLASGRLLPGCCTLMAVAFWGVGLVPLVGLKVFLHSTALLMTQLSILSQLNLHSCPETEIKNGGGLKSAFRLQFSLRTLMAASLIVCIVLGYPQWLATLRGAHLPVLTVTMATGFMLLMLLAIGTLHGWRVLLSTWLLLLGLTLHVVGPTIDGVAWWRLARFGYLAEVVIAVCSMLVMRQAGWQAADSNFARRIRLAARRGHWLTRSRQPQSAAP
jgi:hypothetical protein